MGGSVALEYAVRDKSVDGVVILTPKLDDPGLNAIALARKYTGRGLLLVTTPEDLAGADAIGALVAGSKVKVMSPRPAAVASGSAVRGTGMLGAVVGIEVAVADFLVEAAGPPSMAPVMASLKGSTFYEQSSRQADQINPANLRFFSSAAEAQARGYRPPKERKSELRSVVDPAPLLEEDADPGTGPGVVRPGKADAEERDRQAQPECPSPNDTL